MTSKRISLVPQTSVSLPYGQGDFELINNETFLFYSRTPFPASDWPDSISELDFDCSEGKTDDVKNCDALSDIGPSCSSPPQRRR